MAPRIIPLDADPTTYERVCSVCGESKALDPHFRPRRIGERTYCRKCKACESAKRREVYEFRARTGDPNSLKNPNERIVVEYYPEWIDDLEVSALRAADECGADFSTEDAWEDFLNVLTKAARKQRMTTRREFLALAKETLSVRMGALSHAQDAFSLAAV